MRRINLERIKDIILKNEGVEFVVVVHFPNEHETLKNILKELGFEASIPIAPVDEFMDSVASDEGYANCWRISKSRGVAWNPSILHWKQYYSDILEINSEGELVFVK